MYISRLGRRPVQEMGTSISPPTGPPGRLVTVEMGRLPPETSVHIGFGALGGNQELLSLVDTDGNGFLITTVQIPSWATQGLRHFFFIAHDDERQQPFAFSGEFHVTDQGGVFTIEGEISDEGKACTAMRTSEDRLYSLTALTQTYEPGTTVQVTGIHVEDPACSEGLVVQVLGIRPT